MSRQKSRITYRRINGVRYKYINGVRQLPEEQTLMGTTVYAPDGVTLIQAFDKDSNQIFPIPKVAGEIVGKATGEEYDKENERWKQLVKKR